ncbi:hypothetical protein LTR28_011814 [Elasticomyces elasticus]|nr:hypothetical protein LTR28_011814 [Elasticomyces elasticus]
MEDPGSPADLITVLGAGVQQEAAAKRGPGKPKARAKRRRHQEDEGDTDFEAPVSFNSAVDAGFTRATRFNSGSNSKGPGLETLVQLITSLQNTLAEQRETQAREEQAQKKAAETAEETANEAAKATKELKDQIESLKEDIKALSSGQVSPERTQIGQGESTPRSHPTSAWPSLPTSTTERPTTVSHISSTGSMPRRPADEEKRIVNIDARRARCEKRDIAKVKGQARESTPSPRGIERCQNRFYPHPERGPD